MPNNVISNSISFLKARQGGSAFVVDLNNEMNSIVVDENGDTTDDIELSPLVRAFYGSQDVISSCTVTASSDDPDMTVEYNNTTHCVDISISEGTHLNDITTITISVVHSTYGNRDIDFIIGAVRNGANGAAAVLQELLPSINEISFSRTTGGSLTPASRDLSLLIKKTEGGTTEEQAVSDSGLYVRWATYMPKNRTEGAAWGSGTATGISWSDGKMQIASSTTFSNICIAAFKTDNTLVDMETIPVIKDGEHGDAAPYYFKEQYAWSNDATTADVTTAPTISGSWSDSIPSNTSGLAYLWRKSVRYVWDSNSRLYSTETAQYFRMSGTNGTSINTKGEVNYAYNNYSDLPTTSSDIGKTAFIKSSAAKYTCFDYQGAPTWISGLPATAGDAYTVKDAGNFGGGSIVGHLIQLNSEANTWLDLGQFKGESGVTYYTHIAWATEVTLESSALPIPAGQTNRPNALAANISGFSITPLSGVSYAWMGYLIDTNSFDSQTKQNYTWQRNKGEKGNDASEVNPNILLRTIFDDGIDKVKEVWSSDWTVTSIDAATDTVVQGRKSLRINMANGQTEYCDLFQVIFGKLKASTWYTVSFNYFATQAWNTFLHSNVGNYPAYYDASAGIIIDGVMQTMSGNNGTWQWPADWTGQRHTMTFKTASDLSGIWNNSQLLFRVPQGCQLALCMPKLEIGQVATAYMANEDDLRGEKGDQGDRGKVGRFFYFGGVFNAADTTQTFIVNDAQAPYFEHTVDGQKRYHVFNYDTNGTYTMAQMWSIKNNWNSKPWESMTNDFKYLITEALFGAYAHLGSFVINGDWMISQQGTINGQESTNYTEFDPDHPNDNTGTNFIPNFAVDGRLGKSYQNDAYINGTVQAKKIYTRLERLNLNLLEDNGSVIWDNIDWTQDYGQRYSDGILPNILVLYSNNVTENDNSEIMFTLPPASAWANFMFDLYVQKTYKYTRNNVTYYSDEIKVDANNGAIHAFDSLDGASYYTYLYESYVLINPNGYTVDAHNKDRDTYVAGWKPFWHVKLFSDGNYWVIVENDDVSGFTWY